MPVRFKGVPSMTQPLTITASWERPVIATGGTPVALHLALVPASHLGLQRPPLDLAFIIDRSGSMHGDRLDLVKQMLFGALGGPAAARSDLGGDLR
jgi:hypothetical protein